MTEPDGAIERLTAQLNHLMSLESVGVMVKTTDLAAVLARAARVAELEAALKPLAALAEKIGTKPKDESCWCGQDGAVIRFGDIRHARALMKEPDQ